MAPRAKAAGGSLASLVASDSEPDINSAAKASTTATASRARGRPRGAVNKTTKTSSKATRRTTDRTGAPAATSARRALVEKRDSNSTRARSKVQKATDRPMNTAVSEDEGGQQARSETDAPRRQNIPRVSRTLHAGGSKPGESNTRQASSHPSGDILHAHGLEPMELDDTEERRLADLEEPSTLDTEVDARDAPSEHDRDDVSIRRRLGELAKSHEDLKMRHRDLREVGVKAAERNFERMRRQAEENISASNKLVLQLKEELAVQSERVEQGEHLRQQLERSEAKCSILQAKLDELATTLSAARSEAKTLSAKLAASRSHEATFKAAGSALKAGTSSGAGPLEMVQAAQAKEDLYADLTGLIVRGLRCGDEEDEFDCIQTGRNGTLHFKLALERGEARDKYQDVQFTYRPQLNPDRDSDLMEMLPDYLVEEITFPRSHASKFYSRVIKSLTERME